MSLDGEGTLSELPTSNLSNAQRPGEELGRLRCSPAILIDGLGSDPCRMLRHLLVIRYVTAPVPARVQGMGRMPPRGLSSWKEASVDALDPVQSPVALAHSDSSSLPMSSGRIMPRGQMGNPVACRVSPQVHRSGSLGFRSPLSSSLLPALTPPDVAPACLQVLGLPRA